MRVSALLLLLLYLFPEGIFAQESWNGPVKVEEFSFDVLDFFAIGWSGEGRVAYGETAPASGGGKKWRWFVQDLIDDAILYESPEWTLMPDQSPAELWALHPEWHSQLIRFDITGSSMPDRGEKIFRIDDVAYRLEAEMDRSESDENPGGLTRQIRINLYRNHNTAKAIYDYQPDPDTEVVDDMVLKGYIRNPGEKRIAVVALEKSGSAPETLSWKYRVFGAHLTLGFTPVETGGSDLAEAVLNGQFYVSRMLLKNGADPEEQDPRGYPALLGASRRGLWDIAQLLLEAGASPDIADDRGRTPLHYAVSDNAEKIVKMLIQLGADPDRPDSAGLSPREEAAIKGYRNLNAYFQ